MTRWEYQIRTFGIEGAKGDWDLQAKRLNEFGQDGWEVVSTTTITFHGHTDSIVYTLKRPLPPTP